jgi:hypothetical protein
MKAITIYQPWAQIIARGVKKYETRSWRTPYRGPLAIHAGAAKIDMAHFFGREHAAAFQEALGRHGVGPPWRYGAVLATCELAGCHRILRMGEGENARTYIQRDGGNEFIQGDELLFGDFTPGRFAWEFAGVKPLPRPVPARDGQRLWEWRQGGG